MSDCGCDKTDLKLADGACWDGYEMVGMKIVDGREVPNCVPVKEMSVEVSAPPYVKEVGLTPSMIKENINK
jgi:hypothetical protein